MDTLTHTPAKVGQRFSVYNGDANGTVLGIDTKASEVTYVFDHALETPFTHSLNWLASSTYALPPKEAK